MIVYGAILPHSPLLIPSIGKEHREKLQATLEAIQTIEKQLYVAKPDTLVIIAPHGSRYPDAYSINLAPTYVGTFKTFGDHDTVVKAKSDMMVIDRLQRYLRTESIPFTLTSTDELDYSFTVPYMLLTQHLEHTKLVPISPSMQDGAQHFAFGGMLKSVLQNESSRIAIIASADLSHKLTANSPGGASTEGPMFDESICRFIASYDIDGLKALSGPTVENASQCGYRPIMTLLGCLAETNVRATKLSYEAPFGVGYMTASFEIL